MKDHLPFAGGGAWYKGNMHTHTTDSDGCYSPERTVERYRDIGYSFLCTTDHRQYNYNKHLEREGFAIIPGSEVDLNPPGGALCHHLVAFRSEECERNYPDGHRYMEPQWRGEGTVQGVIDELNARGNLVIYCHPVWSKTELADFSGLHGLFGMEVYNTGCHVANNTGHAEIYLDSLFRRKRLRNAFATDDNHKEYDIGGGWICVKCGELSERALVDAMKAGAFYSSTGPEIYDFGVREGSVFIECSEVKEIRFTSFEQFGHNYMAPKGQTLGRAEHKISGGETYIRVECVDQCGMKAWTNAVYIDNLL